jgi:uncharacterized alkaline shock family protein YloU
MSGVAGTINIANDVLGDLAGYAALESYGVVGMTSPTVRDGVAQLLSKDKLRKGVKVHNEADGSVSIDLYVVIEHGTQLVEVSHNLSERVRYVLTNTAEVRVSRVDVHVQDIRVRRSE